MKKYFNELSSARQTELLLESEKLFGEVVEDMVETECYYIQDQIGFFDNTIDYEYGYYTKGYVHMRDKSLSNIRKFVSGLIDSINCFGTLDDIMLQVAKDLYDKTDVLCAMEYDNKQYENLEAHINSEVEVLLEALGKHLTETFEYIEESENVVNYFHEFYKEERMDMSDYYLETETEKLYKVSVVVLN